MEPERYPYFIFWGGGGRAGCEMCHKNDRICKKHSFQAIAIALHSHLPIQINRTRSKFFKSTQRNFFIPKSIFHLLSKVYLVRSLQLLGHSQIPSPTHISNGLYTSSIVGTIMADLIYPRPGTQ